LVLFLSSAIVLRAQRTPSPSWLSAQDQSVITRLASLSDLPGGDWRSHEGDIPHGEDAGLDDSQWPIAKGPTALPQRAMWYRRWIEIPKTVNGYDLTGARIVFRFMA
jgi:alpha-mannosidase